MSKDKFLESIENVHDAEKVDLTKNGSFRLEMMWKTAKVKLKLRENQGFTIIL